MSGKQKRVSARGNNSDPSVTPLTQLYNYSSDAGRGSDTFADEAGLSWRRALLGGVAAGAMWAAVPRQAAASVPSHSNCTFPAPNVMLCQGDQGPGINVQSFEDIKTLNVNSLTKDIAPASAAGIFLNSSTIAALNSDLGAFEIFANSKGSNGIEVSAPNGVTIVHSGDISAPGDGASGILASSSDESTISITSVANITAGKYGNGISADVNGDGSVVIKSTGTIVAGDGSRGISANVDDDGTISVTSKGNVTTGNNSTGIRADIDDDGDVTVASTGNIKTGNNSRGIFANVDDDGSVVVTSKGKITVGENSTGIRADVDDEGDVTVTSTGDITTGAFSSGIEANAGDYGSSTVTSAGNIKTGNYSAGIDVSTGDFGSAKVSSTGNITVGKYSVGIVAQSYGSQVGVTSTGDITGGAGSSGIVATGGYGLKGGPVSKPVYSSGDITVTSVGDITLTGEGTRMGGPFGLGAAGILAFGGGGITIASTGDISTSGDNRSGIAALSYSGGCCSSSAKLATPAGVSIVSTGNVTTTGNNSFGIVGAASYGSVKITSTGDVTTSGERAAGIGVYSKFGDATVTSTGDITASGRNAPGILSYGSDTSTINILGGTVSGGTNFDGDVGASVRFQSGHTNTLNNLGTITGGGSGWAVVGTYGAETVNNFGTISGNVDLVNGGYDNNKMVRVASPYAGAAPSANNFNNGEGATFNSGETVNLGYGGTLTNDGLLNPGGDGKVETTALQGNLVQSAKGTFGVDIDHTANTADRINVSEGGGSMWKKTADEGLATLSGMVAATLLTFDIIKPDKNFTILSAAGGTTHSGLSAVDTALVDYSLLYPNANDVVLGMNVSFKANGLSPNQSALVNYFGRGVGAGMPPELEKVYLALLNAKDTESLGAIVDQLYSSVGGAAATSAIQSGAALAFALRSCPVADGPYGQLRETSCVWAKPTARRFVQDKATDTADVRDTAVGISGGFQAAVGENLWAGLGVSLENDDGVINQTTKTEGSWWQIGGVTKWVQGPWKLSSSISAGQGDIDAKRGINIPGVTELAASSSDIGFVTTLTRLAYSFGANGFYVTPMFDLGATYLDADGYTERGAGALGLVVGSSDEWIISGGPAVEVGSTITADGLTYRPFVKAGVTFLSEDSFSTTARFVGAPASVAAFKINSKFDDVFADISAGIQMFGGQGLNLRLSYDGHYGENSTQHGLDAKLTVNY